MEDNKKNKGEIIKMHSDELKTEIYLESRKQQNIKVVI